jgi:tetratricopeptide (TPR) repeat protein
MEQEHHGSGDNVGGDKIDRQVNIENQILYGDKKIHRYLTAISAAVPANFLGREKELADIRNLLISQNNIALVNAEGGMGKTTLAARYWQQYEQEYKYLAWLFCENGILAAMRSQLPYVLHLTDAMNQYADDVEQQTLVIKTAMANLEKDCLLVLDNANEPDHISGFLHYMTGLGWHVLITSRCSKVLPDAGSEYKITGLPPDKARELFKQHYDEKTADFDALLDRFLKAVGYNTLCIEIFSKNLGGGEGWGMTLETLLEKIEENGLFLGDESFEIIADWTHNTKKVDVKSTDQVVEALYDIAGLQENNPDLQELLITFALLPAESHSPNVLIPLLALDDKPGLKHRLDQLTQKGWLSTDNTTYRISPVVQKILLHRNADRLWTLGQSLVTKLLKVFETDGHFSKNISTAAPFADLVFDLVDNLNTGNEYLAVLFDKLWVYYHNMGNFTQAMNTAEKLRQVCEKYDYKLGLAISYSKLGLTHTSLNNLDKALTSYEEFYILIKELYQSNQSNLDIKTHLAVSMSRLGKTYLNLGNLEKALSFFEDFNSLYTELNEAYPNNAEIKNGLAISYSKLGSTHESLGNLNKALIFFEECNRIMKEIYDNNRSNLKFKFDLNISLGALGEINTSLGNLEKALIFFEESERLCKELIDAYPMNVDFKIYLVKLYSKFGEIYYSMGNLETTLIFYENSNRLAKELYEINPTNMRFKKVLTESYGKLVITHISLDNLGKALSLIAENSQLIKQL